MIVTIIIEFIVSPYPSGRKLRGEDYRVAVQSRRIQGARSRDIIIEELAKLAGLNYGSRSDSRVVGRRCRLKIFQK